MTEKKTTKKEFYAGIIEAMKTGDCPISPDEVIAFCENEIALLDKKAAKAKERQAAKRAEGDELTEIVKEALTDEFQVTADIAKAVVEATGNEDYTIHKIQYRLGQLVKNSEAESTDVKIPGGEGQKTRTIKGYRLLNA
jgi:hypothetical protein